MSVMESPLRSYLALSLAGGLAGVSVDVTLYPLDTLKTRLQSQQGFYKTGGFNGVYRGFFTVASTSMPTTALFFLSYEATKSALQPKVDPQYAPAVHMFAASVGEVLACLIRVPAEIVKQRKQTYVGSEKRSAIWILSNALRTEGVRRGMYRGFLSTVIRDLPFSFIELPLWEFLKTAVRNRNNGEITIFQSATCGALAGAIAAASTTPLDVAKTRIQLAEANKGTGTNSGRHSRRVPTVLAQVYRERGLGGVFAGVSLRFCAFFVGGFVFFGVYDDSKRYFEQAFNR